MYLVLYFSSGSLRRESSRETTRRFIRRAYPRECARDDSRVPSRYGLAPHRIEEFGAILARFGVPMHRIERRSRDKKKSRSLERYDVSHRFSARARARARELASSLRFYLRFEELVSVSDRDHRSADFNRSARQLLRLSLYSAFRVNNNARINRTIVRSYRSGGEQGNINIRNNLGTFLQKTCAASRRGTAMKIVRAIIFQRRQPVQFASTENYLGRIFVSRVMLSGPTFPSFFPLFLFFFFSSSRYTDRIRRCQRI